MAKKFLTNERIKRNFKSNFALANYAIMIGREVVMGGKFLSLDELLADIRRRAETTDNLQEKEQYGIS